MLNFVKLYKLLNELYKGGYYILIHSNGVTRLVFNHSNVNLECNVDGVLIDNPDNWDICTIIPNNLPLEYADTKTDVKIALVNGKVEISLITIPEGAVIKFPYDNLSAVTRLNTLSQPFEFKRDLNREVFKEMVRILRSPKVSHLKVSIKKGDVTFDSVYSGDYIDIYSRSELKDLDYAGPDIELCINDTNNYRLSNLMVQMLMKVGKYPLNPEYRVDILQYNSNNSLTLRKFGGKAEATIMFTNSPIESVEIYKYKDIKNLKYLAKINTPARFIERLGRNGGRIGNRADTVYLKTGNTYIVEQPEFSVSDSYISGFHTNNNEAIGIFSDILWNGLVAYTQLYPKSESVQISVSKTGEDKVFVFNELGKDNYIFIKLK
jgi:hypothetical protein